MFYCTSLKVYFFSINLNDLSCGDVFSDFFHFKSYKMKSLSVSLCLCPVMVCNFLLCYDLVVEAVCFQKWFRLYCSSSLIIIAICTADAGIDFLSQWFFVTFFGFGSCCVVECGLECCHLAPGCNVIAKKYQAIWNNLGIRHRKEAEISCYLQESYQIQIICSSLKG